MFGETKLQTVPITKRMVWEAYKQVKSKKGSGGIDGQSLKSFQEDELNHLYKLWNRLSSGSYFPKAVKQVIIPKGNGGTRALGIPTITDRIAQQVVKNYLEPRFEKVFHENSFGYRPSKNAHQAISVVQENNRHYNWVLDLDISNFFDEVNHELLMKALDLHVEEKWAKFYITRWLETPIQDKDGNLIQKFGKGTPQGGVISPLLANLYLHYVLDKWLTHNYPRLTFVRYADDVIIHCQNENEAKLMMVKLQERLLHCGLRMNETKSKIVKCNQRIKSIGQYSKKYDFLGFSFQPRCFKTKGGKMFIAFDCGMSIKSETRIVSKWRADGIYRGTNVTIQDIANKVNPEMIGIIRYYGTVKKWCVLKLIRKFHQRLVLWVLKKYTRYNRSRYKAYKWLNKIKSNFPNLFYHWSIYPRL